MLIKLKRSNQPKAIRFSRKRWMNLRKSHRFLEQQKEEERTTWMRKWLGECLNRCGFILKLQFLTHFQMFITLSFSLSSRLNEKGPPIYWIVFTSKYFNRHKHVCDNWINFLSIEMNWSEICTYTRCEWWMSMFWLKKLLPLKCDYPWWTHQPNYALIRAQTQQNNYHAAPRHSKQKKNIYCCDVNSRLDVDTREKLKTKKMTFRKWWKILFQSLKLIDFIELTK